MKITLYHLENSLIQVNLEYNMDDEVEITGTVTVWADINSQEYFSLEIETINKKFP